VEILSQDLKFSDLLGSKDGKHVITETQQQQFIDQQSSWQPFTDALNELYSKDIWIMRLPDNPTQNSSYMCKMIYFHPGVIGGEDPAKDLNTLEKLWSYIQHPNDDMWTGDFDYQLIICQDYTEFEHEINKT